VWHSEFKFYLYPEKSQHKIDSNSLEVFLKNLEFISNKLSAKRHATGGKFLSLLTFMGCSPNIELEPQDDKPYCYIEIESQNEPLFISGKNTKYPPCPHCKSALKSLTCSSCKKKIDPQNLNWRKSAFIASSWICIANIYELEAIPNDQLLNALEAETGVKWKPAYIRQEQI